MSRLTPHAYGLAAAGEIAGPADSDELEPVVAAAGQEGKSPQDVGGDLQVVHCKDSTPWICKKRGGCWKNCSKACDSAPMRDRSHFPETLLSCRVYVSTSRRWP
jgi:hypothetical protein